MRIILSCILSFALVLCSTPLAYADESVSDGLVDLPLVSLSGPALDWVDNAEGEEEAEEELNEEGLNVTGLSSNESDSESFGESTFDDSSSDDLFEDSEEIDQGEVSSLSAITPLNTTSLSWEYVLGELVFRIMNNVLDLGADSFTDWLSDVLGITPIDYTEEIYDFLYTYTYGQLNNIVYYTRDIDSYMYSISSDLYSILYVLSGDIWLTLTSIDGSLGTATSRLSTINSTLSTGFQSVVDAVNNISLNLSLDSLTISANTEYQLFSPYYSIAGIRVVLLGWDYDTVESWNLYRLDTDGTITLVRSSTSSVLLLSNDDQVDGALYYAEVILPDWSYSNSSGNTMTVNGNQYYTSYYYIGSDGLLYEYTNTGVYGIYETMLDILEAIENLSVGDLTIDDAIFDDIYDELVTVRQNSAYLASLGSFGSLLSNTSIANDYLSDIYLSLSIISGNLISALLELGSISSDAEDTVDLLSDIYAYIYSGHSLLNSILNCLEDVVDLIDNLGGTDYSSALADILDAIKNVSVDVEVDVTVDESSFSIWDLLVGAIAVGTITSAISNLATAAEDTFPIGALVMVAQFLVLLDSDPVAPVYSGEIYGVTVEIDLSPYDNMALICRYMLFALYVIGLYKSTKDWAFPVDGD